MFTNALKRFEPDFKTLCISTLLCLQSMEFHSLTNTHSAVIVWLTLQWCKCLRLQKVEWLPAWQSWKDIEGVLTKVPPYHLSGGNGKTHERPNETSSKYRQSPTFVHNSWKRIWKSNNRHIYYKWHSIQIAQYINVPYYKQPTKQLCQPLRYIHAWIQPKVIVKRSRHHTSEYPPHFWWLHKGCPMKLNVPRHW
jgi:hypothetical protein